MTCPTCGNGFEPTSGTVRFVTPTSATPMSVRRRSRGRCRRWQRVCTMPNAGVPTGSAMRCWVDFVGLLPIRPKQCSVDRWSKRSLFCPRTTNFMPSFYAQVGAHMRRPEESFVEQDRLIADNLLFPYYREEIRFAHYH